MVAKSLRTLSLSCVLAAAILAAGPAIAKEQPSKTWKTSMAVHLRAAPANQSAVIAQVPKDALLTSLQPCAKGWCSVKYKGLRGWIFDTFIVEQPAKTAGTLSAAAQALAKTPLEKTPLQKPMPASLFAPAAPSMEGAGASYRVIGLPAGERLPLREGPLDTSRVIAELPPDTAGIAKLETCRRPWCLVAYKDTKGYLQGRFLGRTVMPSRRYGVDGETDLKVLTSASAEADIAGEIPYYASGIVPIGDCNSEWCHVRYLGLVGFVDAHRLRLETSPKG